MAEPSDLRSDPDFAAALGLLHDRRYSAASPATYGLLSCVPVWNERLAVSAGFPADGQDLGTFIDSATATGLVTTWTTYGEQGVPTRAFAARASERPVLFDRWRAVSNHQERAAAIAGLGATVRRVADGQPDDVAPAALHWAELAELVAEPVVAGRRLYEIVAGLIVSGDLVSAEDWVYAGEALAEIGGPALRSAARRAGRSIGLAHRRRADQRHLRHYVARPALDRAVRELLASPDDRWGLHLLGVGGVGKTMLIRALSAGRLSEEETTGPARLDRPSSQPLVARVDFDHLDATFPLERPGNLLLELSEDLLGVATNDEHDRRRIVFVDAVDDLHELLSGSDRPEEPADILATDEAKRMVDAFVGLISLLQRPIVLVLDTCEELAKVHLTGSRAPAVEATFIILEMIQERIVGRATQRVRVLLAGRRYLALGDGDRDSWSAAPPIAPWLAGIGQRSWLSLVPVGAFDKEEAERYLTERGITDRDLRTAILTASGDSDGARFNPFELGLYADWLDEEPHLDPAVVAAGSTTYAKARIIDRVDHEIRGLVPFVAELGQWDSATLAVAQPLAAGDDGRRLEQLLLDQEWVDLVRQDDHAGRILGIRHEVVERLRAYYDAAENRAERDRTRATLRRGLAQMLSTVAPPTLPSEAVIAAAELIDDDHFALLWQSVEEHIEKTGQWSWAVRTGELLLGVWEGRLKPVSRSLVDAVTTTVLAAEEHGVRNIHADVWARLGGADGIAGTRALLGGLAASWRNGSPLPQAALARLRAVLDSGRPEGTTSTLLDGAVLVGLEAIAECPPLEMPFAADVVARWRLAWDAVGTDRDLHARAFMRSIEARLWARQHDTARASRAFADATAMARGIDDETPCGLLHWPSPRSARCRVEAERLHFRVCNGESIDAETLSALIETGHRRDDEDSQCLAALAISTSIDRGHLDVLRSVIDKPATRLSWARRCGLHAIVAPLPVAVARAQLAAGLAVAAKATLAVAASLHNQSRIERELVVALDRGLIDVERFLRDGHRPTTSLGDGVGEDAAWARARLIESPDRSTVPDSMKEDWSAERQHAYLRTWTAWSGDDRPSRMSWDGTTSITTRANLRLDWFDVIGRGPADGVPLADDDGVRLAVEDISTVLKMEQSGVAPRVAVGEALRLELRAWALGVEGVSARAPRPPGLVARLALEEGELLALRAPDRACRLLELAAENYRVAGNLGGSFFANLRWAIALVHDDRAAEAADVVSVRVRPAYDLWAGQTLLPSWDELSTPESAVDTAPDKASTREAWEGWLTRLHLVRQVLGEGKPRLLPGRSPFELDLDLRRTVTAPPTPWRRRRLWRMSTDFVSVAVGLGVLAVLSRVVAWLLDRVGVAHDLSGWAGIGLTLGAFAVIGLVADGVRRMRGGLITLVNRGTYVEAAIRTDRATKAPVLSWRIRVSADPSHSSLRWLLRLSLSLTTSLSRLLGSKLLTVGSELSLAPDVVWDKSKSFLVGEQRFKVVVALDVDLALRGEAWERELARALFPEGLPDKGAVRAYRMASPPTASPSAADRPTVVADWLPGDGATIIGGKEWSREFADIWTLTTPSGAGVDVCHLVGEPVLTSLGWRLRPAGDSAPTSSGSDDNPLAGSSDANDGRLRAPADLSSAPLIVVQVTPSGDVAAVEPASGAALRSFCHEAAELAPGHVVLGIPRLPPQDAIDVVATVATMIHDIHGPPHISSLLDVLTAARGLVTGPAAPEVAYEFCLISTVSP